MLMRSEFYILKYYIWILNKNNEIHKSNTYDLQNRSQQKRNNAYQIIICFLQAFYFQRFFFKGRSFPSGLVAHECKPSREALLYGGGQLGVQSKLWTRLCCTVWSKGTSQNKKKQRGKAEVGNRDHIVLYKI